MFRPGSLLQRQKPTRPPVCGVRMPTCKKSAHTSRHLLSQCSARHRTTCAWIATVPPCRDPIAIRASHARTCAGLAFCRDLGRARPRIEPQVEHARNARSMLRPGHSARDRVRTGLGCLCECLNGPRSFPRSPRLDTSARADLATSRSCHSDSGTNIPTTSFGPSLHGLSHCVLLNNLSVSYRTNSTNAQTHNTSQLSPLICVCVFL